MTDLDEIRHEIRQFRDARDWRQFHTPKNLACSIAIEAGELLEHFQWLTAEEGAVTAPERKAEIAHEIADVAIYVMMLCDSLEIDLAQAIRDKLALNAKRYPVAKAKGLARKYDKL